MDQLKPIIRTSLNSQFQNYISKKCLKASIKPQKVLIDFSSPNIAKPFHPGHLRATLIGNFVANINKVFGHDVCRINYLGDWGKQFGFLLNGLNKFNSKPLQELTLENYFEIYSKSYSIYNTPEFDGEIKNILYKLDNGDEELTRMWSDIKCYSFKNLKSIYKRLGIEFDVYEFESDYNERSKQYVRELANKLSSIIQEDVSLLYMVSPSQKLPLLSREGLSLYITRDIAAAVSRLEVYKPDRMHYVVENGQFFHFEALKQILLDIGHNINDFPDSVYPRDFHIKFNRVNNMSTRKGNVIFIDSMLDSAKSLMLKKLSKEGKVTLTSKDKIEDLAEKLSLTILFSEFLKPPRQNPFSFSWDRDNLGFKLQYCRASLNSLEEKCYENDIHPDLRNCFDFKTYDYFNNYPTSLNLIHHIVQYDKVLYRCYKESESYFLMNYVTQLVGYINNALRETKVIGCNSKSEAATRLKLFSVSKFILDHSFDLLGFPEIYKI